MNAISSSITREQLIQLPIRRYEGPVCLVASAQDLERAVHDIRHEHVIGVDTETRPAFQKGQSYLPSLMQIATAREVFLFQLRRRECFHALADLLENPGLIKAGIGFTDDLRKLKELFPFAEKTIFHLDTAAQQNGIIQSGVRNLAGLFLGFRITKGPQTSNWARAHLSPSQITYAATDAWVCRELYLRFHARGWKSSATKPVPLATASA